MDQWVVKVQISYFCLFVHFLRKDVPPSILNIAVAL